MYVHPSWHNLKPTGHFLKKEAERQIKGRGQGMGLDNFLCEITRVKNLYSGTWNILLTSIFKPEYSESYGRTVLLAANTESPQGSKYKLNIRS